MSRHTVFRNLRVYIENAPKVNVNLAQKYTLAVYSNEGIKALAEDGKKMILLGTNQRCDIFL